MIDVSIIIVNYKTVHLLDNAIQSVINKTKNLNYEIIVVDNCSGDSFEELIAKYDVKVIVLGENIGFGRANNKASKLSKGRNLFFLNPDTYLLNNGIKILSDYLDNNKNVGIVGGNLYSSDLKPNLSYGMLYPSILFDLDGVFSRVGFSLTKMLYGKNYIYNNTTECKSVAYITGADLMIRKEVFDLVRGFNPCFFMYCEDSELAYRVKKLGYEIINVPEAKIVHLEGKSILYSFMRKKRYYEGRKTFYHCHYSCIYRILSNSIELILLTTAFILFKITGNVQKTKIFKEQLVLFYKINFKNKQ